MEDDEFIKFFESYDDDEALKNDDDSCIIEYDPKEDERARKALFKIIKSSKKRKLQETGKEKKKKSKKFKYNLDMDLSDYIDSISKITTVSIETDESCVHEVALPADHTYVPLSTLDEKPLLKYPFELDPFQKRATLCISNNQSVLVSAHTSAGKTVVAEHAVAMCLKNNQRIIYTTPIKALSNQKFHEFSYKFKDVGLMTGDTTIQPNASCLIMTTEILRSMLYKGSEITREIGWVVFDEIHYMKDKERGYVWEETICMLESLSAHFVFLSATIPNARQFAQWICWVHNQPCHAVYTENRPVPLEHYVYPAQSGECYLIVNDKGEFKENNFNAALSCIQKAPESVDGTKQKGGNRHAAQLDSLRIIKMILKNNNTPAIVFSFSKRECEFYASQAARLDLTTKSEKEKIDIIIKNAFEQIENEEDRNLPHIQKIIPLLRKGIGIHHGGLLPLVKEVTEILFGEGLISLLFATETFAMGLNMPAKTDMFTSIKKFDGKNFRWLTSGEYIQMSGRAGRRGKDKKGIVIMKVDENLNAAVVKNLIKGKADCLNSSFRLTYHMVLNMLRLEALNPEQVLRNSFYQFQNFSKIPEIIGKIDVKVKELKGMEGSNMEKNNDLQMHLFEKYYRLSEDLKALELERHKMLVGVHRDKFIQAIVPGQLVYVINNGRNFGWCVAVKKVVLKSKEKLEENKYLQIVAKVSRESIPEDSKMIAKYHPVIGHCLWKPVLIETPIEDVWDIMKYSIKISKFDLNSKIGLEHVTNILNQIVIKKGEVIKDPIEDLKIKDSDLSIIINEINRHKNNIKNSKIHECPFKDKMLEKAKAIIEKKEEISILGENLDSAKGLLQLDELKKMKNVLRSLKFINDDDSIGKKGRIACEISSADQLLLTEMMLNGQFNDLDPAEICSLMSVFICTEQSKSQPCLNGNLTMALNRLKETAKKVAYFLWFWKLEGNQDDYVQRFQPSLMEVVYKWCQGSSFREICKLTQIYEGSIWRNMKRLVELLRQMQDASKAIGIDLEERFAYAISLLHKDLLGIPSVYM